MSYYESRIKALEEKVAEMAKRERMKAIPVEAQLIDSIAKLKADLHNCYTAIRVKDEENARLKAEVERLTERNKFLEQIDSYLQGANENAYEKRCDELEAEVERLRKAGDAMEGSIILLSDLNDKHPAIKAWNAAKEGKPSV